MESKWIFLIILAGLLPQCTTDFIEAKPLRTFLYNAYTPFELILLYGLLARKFQDAKKRNMITTSLVTYIFLFPFILWFYGAPFIFASQLVCLNHVLYVFWLLLFLLEQYKTGRIELYRTNPFFWYFMGLMIYASCSALLFALYHTIAAKPDSPMKKLWYLHDVFNILLYIFLSIGLYLNHEKKFSRPLVIKFYA